MREIKDCFVDMENQTESMEDMINTVLDLEKVESEKFELEKKWFSPTLLTNKLTSLVRVRFEEQKVENYLFNMCLYASYVITFRVMRRVYGQVMALYFQIDHVNLIFGCVF